MKLNVNKIRRMAFLLGLVMLLSVVCASCVNLDNVDEVNPRSALAEESKDTDVSDEEIVIPEGTTNLPEIATVVNSAPYTIAVSGKCEKDAVIRVTGGKEDAETVANGEYFIIKVDLAGKNDLLKVSAQAEGKDESPKVELRPNYDATAQNRLDGNSVSVGVNSRLYFDKMEIDATAKNLYTESQLKDIKTYVNSAASSYYYDRAKGQPVELIYVLVPNVTTIYPDVLPVKSEEYTIYDQVLSALNETQATVVDMRAIFESLRDDKTVNETYGGLYRVTDSSLTDYGAYLTYKEIMTVVTKNFPEAAPKALEDFEWSTVDAKGGNLVNYRELDGSVIGESLVVSKPKFSLALGSNDAGTSAINSLRKYVDTARNDYNFFVESDADDKINGISERWLVDTAREGVDLPNAIIYRDYSSLAFTDILAERFQKSLLVESGNYNLNLSELKTYAAPGKNVADYVIVIVSEENFDTAFNSALAG
ncbi:MAG: hypothetical protein E7586_03970 [Ruminococcaceae bacterium]|nr:hypothetical protein [Oscillospiraceae bacterium]